MALERQKTIEKQGAVWRSPGFGAKIPAVRHPTQLGRKPEAACEGKSPGLRQKALGKGKENVIA
ncbi:protein of unknown function [Methylacidimicrobium sp. AP8]|nr:protein of unknown function [Methylacidimicrobium sp. AP8]